MLNNIATDFSYLGFLLAKVFKDLFYVLASNRMPFDLEKDLEASIASLPSRSSFVTIRTSPCSIFSRKRENSSRFAIATDPDTVSAII